MLDHLLPTGQKILLNSVILDAKKWSCFMCAYLNDNFLHTPMNNSEYMLVPYYRFPEDLKQFYNPSNIVSKDNYINIRINKESKLLPWDTST